MQLLYAVNGVAEELLLPYRNRLPVIRSAVRQTEQQVHNYHEKNIRFFFLLSGHIFSIIIVYLRWQAERTQKLRVKKRTEC